MTRFHPLSIALLCAIHATVGTESVYSDKIVLENGSVLLGTVKSLDRGDLVFDADHIGDVKIDWDAVESLTSDQRFTVESDSGQRVVGTIGVTDGQLVVTGDEPLEVDRDAVALFEPYERGMWNRFDFTIDIGLNLVRGNSTTSAGSLDAAAGYRGKDFEVLGRLTTIHNQQVDAQNTDRQTLDFLYNRQLGNRWQAGGLATFESDDAQQLDLRTQLGGTFGRRVIHTDNARLTTLIGIAYVTEEFVDTPTNESFEGIVGVTFSGSTLGDSDVTTTLFGFPSFEEDRYRVNFDATWRIDVVGDLSFALTFYDTYDSNPPIEGVQSNDYGLTTSLGWSF